MPKTFASGRRNNWVTISINKKDLAILDKKASDKGFSNRAEFIRDLVTRDNERLKNGIKK